MAHPDHDQVIGRLVGARLRGAAGRPPGVIAAAEAHPDAETWAAYVDGGLLPAEVIRLEDHLAGCGVCRRLVAALAPEVSAAAKPAAQEAAPSAGRATVLPFPRRQLFAWMSVAAALFAAVTLWSVSRLAGGPPVADMAVSGPAVEPVPPAAASSSSRPAPAELDETSAAPAPPARGEPGAATGPAAGGAVGTAAKPVAAPRPGEDKRLADAAPAAASPADARQIQLQTNTAAAGAARARGPLAAQAANTRQNAPAVQAPPPPAPAGAAPRAAREAPPAPAAPAAARPAAEQASAAADASAAEARERRDPDQQPGGLAEMVTTTRAAPTAGAGRGQRAAAGAVGVDRAAAAPPKDELAKVASFAFAAPPAVFAEPGGRLRWRIAEGRRLESSSDGGTTWTARYTTRGGRLRAGAAPAIDSAWAVGERGLVLRLSVPGGWTVVAPPAEVTLIGVSATGAQSARVTAADGRVFETADGGATWTAATPGAGPP